MRIGARYSHLNGEEFLIVHRKALWEEVLAVIESVDAESCRTKVSRERTKAGDLLYSPVDMNKAMETGFKARGWEQRKTELLGHSRRGYCPDYCQSVA